MDPYDLISIGEKVRNTFCVQLFLSRVAASHLTIYFRSDFWPRSDAVIKSAFLRFYLLLFPPSLSHFPPSHMVYVSSNQLFRCGKWRHFEGVTESEFLRLVSVLSSILYDIWIILETSYAHILKVSVKLAFLRLFFCFLLLSAPLPPTRKDFLPLDHLSRILTYPHSSRS
jgi:hypothetical protein